MKLSEAIRLGAMLRPQTHGGLYSFKPRGILGLTEERIGTCALGAAFEAAGCHEGPSTGAGVPTRAGEATPDRAISLPSEWVFMIEEQPCPVCAIRLHVVRVISHLNDDHEWTREEIADWVETVEAAAQAHSDPASVNALDPTAQPQERCVRAGTV